MIIISNNKNCPRQKNAWSNFHRHRQSQLVTRESSSKDGGETSQIQNSSSSSTDNNDNDKDLLTINISINEAKSTLKQLYILPILSLLSGLSPASRIIAESHISRIPDCPIAHDMDTLLLWPAISKTTTTTPSSPPPTVFQAPIAAITNVDSYQVDWSLVWSVYSSRVIVSMGISIGIALIIILFLSTSTDFQKKSN